MVNEIKLSIDIMSPDNKASLIKAAKIHFNAAIIKAIPHIRKDLKRAISTENVMGFIPFNKTDLWNVLNDKDTLAELGFTSKNPLDDLLYALEDTVEVEAFPNKLVIRMVEMELIGKLTIHPSAGTGLLGEISWFVDWIINGIPVDDYTFIRTGPPRPRSSRISGRKAGLMLPVSTGAGSAEATEGFSGGFWQFDPIWKDFLDQWLKLNLYSIKSIAFERIKKAIKN